MGFQRLNLFSEVLFELQVWKWEIIQARCYQSPARLFLAVFGIENRALGRALRF